MIENDFFDAVDDIAGLNFSDQIILGDDLALQIADEGRNLCLCNGQTHRVSTICIHLQQHRFSPTNDGTLTCTEFDDKFFLKKFFDNFRYGCLVESGIMRDGRS